MWTGISLSLLTGILWIVIGILFRYAGNRINMFDATLVYSALQLPFFCFMVPDYGDFQTVNWLLQLLMVCCGIGNIVAMLLLQKAMADGNSGVAWAIGQSALVASFVSGLLFFGEVFSLVRCSGALLIVLGMVVLGFSQKGSKGDGKSCKWLLYAFGAFLLLCFAQSIVAAASNWKLSSGMRGVLMIGGAVVFLAVKKFSSSRRSFAINRVFLITVIGLTVLGVVSMQTNFMSLDYLSTVNLSGIGYPLSLGSCIAGFALYSIFVLKEKANVASVAGIAAISLGIFLMPDYRTKESGELLDPSVEIVVQ